MNSLARPLPCEGRLLRNINDLDSTGRSSAPASGAVCAASVPVREFIRTTEHSLPARPLNTGLPTVVSQGGGPNG